MPKTNNNRMDVFVIDIASICLGTELEVLEALYSTLYWLKHRPPTYYKLANSVSDEDA